MPNNHPVTIEMKSFNIRHVLIPIDNSVQSNRAFEWYLKEARKKTDQVTFVSMLKPEPTSSLLGLRITRAPVLIGTQLRIDRQTLIESKALCRDYVRRAHTFGVRARVLVCVDSHPGSQMARLIASNEADLVVFKDFEEMRMMIPKVLKNGSEVSIYAPPSTF